MQALLEQGGYDMPQRGDIREGTVLSVSPQEVIIDLGLKREGIVPANDLARLDKDILAEVQEGTTWPVYILQTSDREGNLIVSLSRAQQEKDWLDAQKMMDSNEIFEAQVTGFNSGGLEVAFGKLRGFVPASHISTLPRNASEDDRKERLAGYVGKTVPVKVVEVDRRRRRLIMSERAAHRRWQREHRKQLLDEIQVGDVRTGIVRSLAEFGAFIDLGGADGLVHISELAWFPVAHPSEVLKVGQEVEAKVLRVDKARERIGLSIKRTLPDPWTKAEEDYRVEELIEAVVTRVVDFGAFVRLRTGVEGLLHVTEMADITPDHPQSLVSPGDLLLLRVLRIEPDRRRIGLSLRQVSESEWADWAAQYYQKHPAAVEEAPAAAADASLEADLAMAPEAEPEMETAGAKEMETAGAEEMETAGAEEMETAGAEEMETAGAEETEAGAEAPATEVLEAEPVVETAEPVAEAQPVEDAAAAEETVAADMAAQADQMAEEGPAADPATEQSEEPVA
jgi:small subunit ribosomal protein S1